MPAVVAAPDRWVDLSSDDVEGRWLEFKSDAATTSDGQLLGYATDAGPEAICYRADLFEEAGLPTDRAEVAGMMSTWDDYYALGEEFVVQESDAKWYDASGSIAQAMLNQVEYPFEQSDNSVDVENDELQAVYNTVTAQCRHLLDRGRPVERRLDRRLPGQRVRHHALPGLDAQRHPRQHRRPRPEGRGLGRRRRLPRRWRQLGRLLPRGPEDVRRTRTRHREFAAWITAPEQQIKIFEQYGNFPSQVAALEDPALLDSAPTPTSTSSRG